MKSDKHGGRDRASEGVLGREERDHHSHKTTVDSDRRGEKGRSSFVNPHVQPCGKDPRHDRDSRHPPDPKKDHTRDSYRDRGSGRDSERGRGQEKGNDRDRERDSDRNRDREKDTRRDSERDKGREKDTHRDANRERVREKDRGERGREMDRGRDRDTEREKRPRSRSPVRKPGNGGGSLQPLNSLLTSQAKIAAMKKALELKLQERGDTPQPLTAMGGSADIEDPLDAYMAGIETSETKKSAKSGDNISTFRASMNMHPGNYNTRLRGENALDGL